MEDEADGSCSASKLKALFETEQQKLQVGNPSFQYQPPKLQPRVSFAPSFSSQVLFSTELSNVVFMLPSGRRQENVGDATIQIIKTETHDQQDSRIVVSNAAKIVVAEVSFTGIINIVPDANCRIAIETSQHIVEATFRSTDTWMEFAKVFVYARYHVQHSVAQVFQDVVCPKDNFREIEDGDVVQVLCKVFLAKPWNECSTGLVFHGDTPEKTIRLEIGSKNFTGLEDGIRGMLKGGRRLLMFKDHDDEDSLAALYDITVARVRKRKTLKQLSEMESSKEMERIPEVPANDIQQSFGEEGSEGKVETVTDRLARMTRAGAAVNLHLFSAPAPKQGNETPKLDSDKLAPNRTGDTGDESRVFVQSGPILTCEHLELLREIKYSQANMSESFASFSSRLDQLVNSKSRDFERRVIPETELVDEESNSEEDNLVESIARMIAENRELKRRLESSKGPRKIKQPSRESNGELQGLEDQVQQILHRISLDMEIEMTNSRLQADTKASLLSSLQQKLDAATASILEIVNQS
ncbi:FK506-binding protein 15 isoform X2 [Selaginella moellendorffii]|uniref:FK506-binding protein 15 isoform X2 n=1 Tax=Selaginella moellendorffii TaxID=88036 RepID=UPI000D1C3DAD|nr:FK506-binding protein 15 isoform X2 [Selaginella moellendorffii]|eukprot:XP_024525500.1 FK506-binding protein 15 isoform X2 [Selaginella moellendorffii]